MRIESVSITNFKRFRSLDLEIKNRALDEIADQFLILGDNGSGKTTVLQAIALSLSAASAITRGIDDFDWVGWVPGRYQRWGTPTVELVVHFSAEELDATQEAARRWWEFSQNRRPQGTVFTEPGRESHVRLRFVGEHFPDNSRAELFQFQGRRYAAALLATDQSARDLFERLPGIFWFDQFRNLAAPPVVTELSRPDGTNGESTGRVSYAVGVARLRDYLNKWKLARMTKITPSIGHDFLLELENLYEKVFPGRSFSDPEPMYVGGIPSPSDYYFTISDGSRTYDIEEMSAGEQSVFPILYEFVRLQIKNSIVLIDEIDLNLHPPLAQRFLRLLPQIGRDCQFIYTTHSESVSEIVSPEQVARLEGGALCR
ncbi:MAG TPA: AAA family ATPase [Bryobacteraceae bacterium]|nr:AAA family ATPase [Bryobacteraceae bacterium]